jgi:hypothetical protein
LPIHSQLTFNYGCVTKACPVKEATIWQEAPELSATKLIVETLISSGNCYYGMRVYITNDCCSAGLKFAYYLATGLSVLSNL